MWRTCLIVLISLLDKASAPVFCVCTQTDFSAVFRPVSSLESPHYLCALALHLLSFYPTNSNETTSYLNYSSPHLIAELPHSDANNLPTYCIVTS